VKSFGLASQSLQTLKGKQHSTADLPDLKMVAGGFEEVKCASIDRLVERLTAKEFPPGKFATTFLLTYPTFMTSSDLITRLTRRFHSLHPSNDSGITLDLSNVAIQLTCYHRKRREMHGDTIEGDCISEILD